jgi:hypothetical protein
MPVDTVTPEVLAAPRKNPHDPGRQQTTRSCLHVILMEEWEHSAMPYATSTRSRPSPPDELVVVAVA